MLKEVEKCGEGNKSKENIKNHYHYGSISIHMC